MPLELVADVSRAQHGAVIDEIFVAPCARPASVLPPLPDIQEGNQISLPHRESAQEITKVCTFSEISLDAKPCTRHNDGESQCC